MKTTKEQPSPQRLGAVEKYCLCWSYRRRRTHFINEWYQPICMAELVVAYGREQKGLNLPKRFEARSFSPLSRTKTRYPKGSYTKNDFPIIKYAFEACFPGDKKTATLHYKRCYGAVSRSLKSLETKRLVETLPDSRFDPFDLEPFVHYSYWTWFAVTTIGAEKARQLLKPIDR